MKPAKKVGSNTKPKHWYAIYSAECVLCGASDKWRERRYTPKPTDPNLTHFHKQEACDHHFM